MTVAIALLLLLVLASSGAIGARRREEAMLGRSLRALRRPRPGADRTPVRFDSLAGLPAPVRRYFRLVLCDGQAVIEEAELRQAGVLRTGPSARRWLRFEARHVVRPPATGFVWDARVKLPLGMHLRVLDGYVEGAGSGRVSLLSAIPLAAESGGAELAAGALHRYLAEGAWCPTALLPQAGVEWSAVDVRTARATLRHGEVRVSLEFRFNDAGEIVGIHTPGRFARAGKGWRLLPWEGRFADYREHVGMRIPCYGEVGWHAGGRLELVWKGHLERVAYELAGKPVAPTAGRA